MNRNKEMKSSEMDLILKRCRHEGPVVLTVLMDGSRQITRTTLAFTMGEQALREGIIEQAQQRMDMGRQLKKARSAQ